jgi:N-acetylglutamate synthase-like GNAT family acetyltransferase
MLIRKIDKKDVRLICQLQKQLFKEDIIHGFVPENEEQIKKLIDSYFLVAEINNGIAGFIYCK